MGANDDPERRHSRALEPEIVSDPILKAEIEGRNGLEQYDVSVQLVQQALSRPSFALRPSLILTLHREALKGLSAYAGNWRPAGVTIEGSAHTPPGAHLVPEFVEEMCDYVNDHWSATRSIWARMFCGA